MSWLTDLIEARAQYIAEMEQLDISDLMSRQTELSIRSQRTHLPQVLDDTATVHPNIPPEFLEEAKQAARRYNELVLASRQTVEGDVELQLLWQVAQEMGLNR